MSDQLIKRLTQNLESQIEMHQVLLETLCQELDLPASCSLSELEDIQSTRTTTVERIRELENSRITLVKRLGSDENSPPKITISDIIKTCAPEEKETLIELKRGLSDIIDQIRAIGKKNAEKATARVACFREVNNTFQKAFHRHPVYSMNGTMNTTSGSCLIKRSI